MLSLDIKTAAGASFTWSRDGVVLRMSRRESPDCVLMTSMISCLVLGKTKQMFSVNTGFFFNVQVNKLTDTEQVRLMA